MSSAQHEMESRPSASPAGAVTESDQQHQQQRQQQNAAARNLEKDDERNAENEKAPLVHDGNTENDDIENQTRENDSESRNNPIDDTPSSKVSAADLDALKVPTTISGIFSASGLWQIVARRTGLLVSLLLLQSLSQFVLESYEHLITYHVVVPLFLTMLVGAGGNAGNQAAVRVIAGLVTGQYTTADTWRVLRSEIAIGLVNGFILAGIGFTRVYWMYEEGSGLFWSALAITLSLFCIVVSSAVLGTLLPFFLEHIGVDREAAAPAIQVIMDITGVLITCVVCTMIIPESEHQTGHHHQSSHATTTTTTTSLPKT